MKTHSSKNVKRSISPLITKTIEASERKKKSISTSNNPYAKVIKEFQTYGRAQGSSNSKKQTTLKYGQNNNGRDSMRIQQQRNKYRIVTEPVDDRIMHLGKSNIFNASFGKLPRSRKRIQKELTEPPVKFNLRASTRSKEKQQGHGQSHGYGVQNPPNHECRNCQKYAEQIDFLKAQMNKIFLTKVLWKNGEVSLSETKDQYGVEIDTGSLNKPNFKSVEGIIIETKKHFYDLMRDIDNLASIDYPKMLTLEIFNYEPSLSSYSDHQFAQIKSLLGQLRSNIEVNILKVQGKVTTYDFEDFDSNSRSACMMRNMKTRMNHLLRENIQLRMSKVVLSKADQLSGQTQQYLKKVIQEVLMSYTIKKQDQ